MLIDSTRVCLFVLCLFRFVSVIRSLNFLIAFVCCVFFTKSNVRGVNKVGVLVYSQLTVLITRSRTDGVINGH